MKSENGYYWVSNDGCINWQIGLLVDDVWFLIGKEEPCWDILIINEERIKTPQELRNERFCKKS